MDDHDPYFRFPICLLARKGPFSEVRQNTRSLGSRRTKRAAPYRSWSITASLNSPILMPLTRST